MTKSAQQQPFDAMISSMISWNNNNDGRDLSGIPPAFDESNRRGYRGVSQTNSDCPPQYNLDQPQQQQPNPSPPHHDFDPDDPYCPLPLEGIPGRESGLSSPTKVANKFGYVDPKQVATSEYAQARCFSKKEREEMRLFSNSAPFNAKRHPSIEKSALPLSKSSSNKQRRKRKHKEVPKRPLSAYNFFFRDERTKILAQTKDSKGEDGSSLDFSELDLEALPEDPMKTGAHDGGPCISSDTEQNGGSQDNSKKRAPPHGLISFQELGRTIGKRWKELSSDRMAYYRNLARIESERYHLELEGFYNPEEPKNAKQQKEILHSAASAVPEKPFPQENDGNSNKSPLSIESWSDEPTYQSQLRDQEQYKKAASMLPPPMNHKQSSFPQNNFSSNRGSRPRQRSSSSWKEPATSNQPPQEETNYIPNMNTTQPLPSPQNVANFPNLGMAPRIIDNETQEGPINIPPACNIVINDSNGEPKQYQLMYAAVEMSREEAHKFMANMCQSAQQVMGNMPPPSSFRVNAGNEKSDDSFVSNPSNETPESFAPPPF